MTDWEATRSGTTILVGTRDPGAYEAFAAPPGVPADRVALLRRAFDDTLKDPAFLADADKMRLEIDPLTGEQVQDIVNRVLGTPKPVINQIQSVLGLPPS